MKDELFGINWNGKESSIDFSDCFGIYSRADVKVDPLVTNVNLAMGNIVNNLNLEPAVIDILISKLSKIKGEMSALQEIKNNIYKELDNIYSYIKQNKALIFFIYYSPDQSNFRLLVFNPINMKYLMDRIINLRPNLIDIAVLNNSNDFYIKDMWARYISENMLDGFGKIDAVTIYKYLMKNMVLDLEAYKDIKRGQRNAKLIVDTEESKYHNPSEIALNKVYRFILFAISPEEESKGLKKIKPELLFHFYMVNNDDKKIPCVKIKIAGSEQILFDEEIKDFELLLHTVSESRDTKNALSDILTRNICSLSCRIADTHNDPKTFNTPKEVIDIEEKLLDKYGHTHDIWSLVKKYIFKNMTYTKDYLEVYKLSKEDK